MQVSDTKITDTATITSTTEIVDKFVKIAKGSFGSIYTNKKIVMKRSFYVTPEIYGFFVRIPNVLSINNIMFHDKYISYEYDYHPNTFMDRGEIFPQDIADLIIALLRLRTLNIVHMDIKPTNIFYNDKGQIQLADLGGIYHLDTDTYVNGGAGTYYTVSPENVLGRQFHVNSQVWSIGMLLYHRLVTDHKNVYSFMRAFETKDSKTLPNVNANLFETFVNEAKESKYNMNIMKNSNHADLQDFIMKCLIINRHTRPTLEDLLKHPFLKSCNTQYEHTNYILTHSISYPINNILGIITQLANTIKKKKIPYKLFSILLHLSLSTPLTIAESINASYLMYYNNCIDILKYPKIYEKLRGSGIMPGNCIYYCVESKEELYKFLRILEICPGVYLTLKPKTKFYTPQYIDLLEYLK